MTTSPGEPFVIAIIKDRRSAKNTISNTLYGVNKIKQWKNNISMNNVNSPEFVSHSKLHLMAILNHRLVDKHVGWRHWDYAFTQAVRKYLYTKVCWTENAAILLQTLTYTYFTLFSIYKLNRLFFCFLSLCTSLHFEGIVHQKNKMKMSPKLLKECPCCVLSYNESEWWWVMLAPQKSIIKMVYIISLLYPKSSEIIQNCGKLVFVFL